MAFSNPFSRDPDADRNVGAYKILTLASWILSVVTTITYSFYAPTDGTGINGTIFGISALHPTPFTMSNTFVGIYWVTLFGLQLGYIWHFFSSNEAQVRSASSVGSHFILTNVLNFTWVMLWTRNHTILSEIVIVIQFLQLTSLNLGNASLAKWIHTPVASLPLTWAFFAVLWNGAVAVHCHGQICRIFANIAIWGILVYAGFFLAVFRDIHTGYATAFLTAGLAVGQLEIKIVALQALFAFVIAGVVFLATSIIGLPGLVTQEEDTERAPLLRD